MLHRSTQVIIIISALFFIVSIVACVGFFFLISKQETILREKMLAQGEAEAHQNSLKSLIRTLADTESERTSLHTRILKDENVVDFLTLIESLGKEQGVALTTKSLTVEPITAQFETLVVNVIVEGSYESVVHMLKLFEHIPYQSTMGTVQILSGGDTQWQGVFQVRVTKFKKV